MAISKALLAPFLIFPVLTPITASDLDMTVIKTPMENSSPGPSPSPQKIDCDGACNGRCHLSKRPRLCKRACGTCCDRCNCVPSGTYDHYEECPCYANMTTHDGKHKCP